MIFYRREHVGARNLTPEQNEAIGLALAMKELLRCQPKKQTCRTMREPWYRLTRRPAVAALKSSHET
ncbi:MULTISPECIES: hypothetical protein [unclassified Caballeronia]|uniref:hypothetical protein n=1 Tax=unclassified Caballeronia TaxID=2646786 RepID=UPI0028541DF0|nr:MULTISPECIES: hypothetical protein [unclassified Caballeronia]MDR5777444.1 hypothetical protein [Caballeronia sp. LZ002]MDR5806350.1 hypothetical protein [Caballeronia sp. LZ001]MDR5852882.1 hypothetical protein [Caballeronia sp. LZ003]